MNKVHQDKNVGIYDLIVRGVKELIFPIFIDSRGSLIAMEFEKYLPFLPRRYFMICDVPAKEIRGDHAHYSCHQFFICIRGSCTIHLDDRNNRTEINLVSPNKGIYVPPMIWARQNNFSIDATLLVFASAIYNPDDYIRNYEDFLNNVTM